ncbi:MAG: ABC transporter permease [Desulfovibrionaceae bacterium]|nr:ABC transporter permease [Desulfovibrionaceae bacterium]
MFACLGADPLRAYAVMARGALCSGYALGELLVKAAPLILTGLAVALARTMLLWNIGCEGQFVMGATASAGFALYLAPDWPAAALLPATVLVGAAGGALWALIPAGLKNRFRVSEILSSLLLNYVAILYMEHLYYGPWRNPQGFGFPGTATLPQAAWLPTLPGSRAHLGLVLGLGLAAALFVALRRTRWGYEVRVMGLAPKAAAYAGMNLPRQTLTVMALSGALAGLAGMGEVCGVQHLLQDGLAQGYGYQGIIAAFLGRLNPLGVVLAALLLAAVMVGGQGLQVELGLPSSISVILTAALLFGFLAAEGLKGLGPALKTRAAQGGG